MHYLVIDTRFGTPIYAFLELDPRGADEYPGLAVREVTLELLRAPGGAGLDWPAVGRRPAIGRDPYHLDRFREFASDGAVARGGFILIEPRYVGPSWEAYVREFRPQGEKPALHTAGRPRAVVRAEK
jgi:hypothetical protein